MTTRVISIRVPSDWQSRVTSDQVRDCVLAWLQKPAPIFQDPGPGSYKLNVRFSLPELAALKRAFPRRKTSGTIRRIAAVRLSLATPQKTDSKSLKSGIGIGIVLLSALLRLVAGKTAVGHEKGQDA